MDMSTLSADEFLAIYPPSLRELANHLRELVRETVPETIESVNVGWKLLAYRTLVGKRAAYWGYIGVDGDHAHLGFEYGIMLDDPNNLLHGDGTQVRYLTIRSESEIRKQAFADLIRQSVAIASRNDKRALLKLEQQARTVKK